MKQRNWHGIDQSRAESLFEYGLLIRWVPAQNKWQTIYRNDNDPNIFSFGWISESDLNEIFTDGIGKNNKDEFLMQNEIIWDKWVTLPMIHRIYDVVSYFGCENVFGVDYSGGDSIKQMCKRLKIKYDERFQK